MKTTVRRRVEELRKELHHHDNLYYNLAQPAISDEQYDDLMRELQDLERAHPELVTPDSPTQRVGGEPTKVFPTVRHTAQMLSLANTYTEDDIRDFDRRVRSLLERNDVTYVCELKFDGVYLPLPIPPEYEHFKATLLTFLDAPALDFRGASVTLPRSTG